MSKVLVIGASGFVGHKLAQKLIADGHAVRCLARDPAKVSDLGALGCEIVKGDISNLAAMKLAFDLVQAAFICVHTLSRQPYATASQGFMDVEIAGLGNVVTACRTSGTKRLIYLTSLGVAANGSGVWLRERWRAEQFLLKSGLDVTVIQPGQIVGVGGTGFDMMVGQAKKSTAIMLGTGKNKWRNIALDDLVYYLVGVLDDPRSYGQIYEVGSDDVLTNDQMVDLTAELLGRKHPGKIHVPPALLGALAPIVERLSKLPRGAMKGLADSLKMDAVGDPTPIRQILPRQPLPYREAVKKALAARPTSPALSAVRGG